MSDDKNGKMPEMRLLLELASRMEESNASDLHLQEGLVPYLRTVAGLIPQDDLEPVSDALMRVILASLIRAELVSQLDKTGSVDAGAQLPGMRLRINAFLHEGGLAVSIRRIPSSPPIFSELNLPSVVKRFANLPRGLVIICGPAGSGKSTTLASLVHHINSTRRAHIITIEDPIEFLHKPLTGLVAQREVGRHSDNFASALREALRQDPDVLLVGEMRDTETIELALRAAETGHLVFSTLHTSGAAGSLSRIVDAFEAGARSTVRVQLSLSLMGVVSQILLATKDGKGRVPACEVLVVNDAVRHLIRENKIEQIPNLIQSGAAEGMLSFASHIAQLNKEGRIDTAGGLEAVGEGWRVADILFEK
ncbi:MAG TPA: PilT/PilU family type 4a pilus ATPase [Firmicutes bacterium]|nr:PilT/PilU family type 4a pilus ATPase [Bacillota bacterium]